MMRSEVYEKPSMRFVDIREPRNIAGNCWHLDANGSVKAWYYDYDDPNTQGGDGYVKFTMGGNCDATLGQIIGYYNVPEGITDAQIQQQLIEDAAKFEFNGEKFDPNEPTNWS